MVAAVRDVEAAGRVHEDAAGEAQLLQADAWPAALEETGLNFSSKGRRPL